MALLAIGVPAQAQSLGDTDAAPGRLRTATLIPTGRDDTITIKADESIGMDAVSIIDPATQTAGNPGAFQDLNVGFDVQPRLIDGFGTRLSYAYHRVDYPTSASYRYDTHDAGLTVSHRIGGATVALSAGATRFSEGGMRQLDTWTIGGTVSGPVTTGMTAIADYHFARTAYAIDRPDSVTHQATLMLTQTIGHAGSYAVAALGLSRQRATSDQLYIFWSSLSGMQLDIDPAYRPYDTWSQAAALSLRLRDILGNPVVTGGADLGYQRRRFDHVDYAINPDIGAVRHDDEIDASAFVQYRLSRHLYGRMTVTRRDTFSNLDAIARHGSGASLGLRWRMSH